MRFYKFGTSKLKIAKLRAKNTPELKWYTCRVSYIRYFWIGNILKISTSKWLVLLYFGHCWIFCTLSFGSLNFGDYFSSAKEVSYSNSLKNLIYSSTTSTRSKYPTNKIMNYHILHKCNISLQLYILLVKKKIDKQLLLVIK